MADVPAWALGASPRATKEALEGVIIAMRDRSGIEVPAAVWRSKASMIEFIEAQRRAFWDMRAETANASRAVEAVREAQANTRPTPPITASECNAFLRSLPPIPLYGEPGCDNCYAEAWDARGLQGQETRWGAHAKRTRTAPANWRKPLSWDRAAAKAGERHRVFCSSLADVFDNHASILPEWRADLWSLIRATPNLDWLLLTKRPGNIAKMLPEDWGLGYPNVWLGCTVVNQAEADRDIPKLLAATSRVRFVSMEPLLGPVNLTALQYGNVLGNPPTYQDALRGMFWSAGRTPDLPVNARATACDRTYVGLCRHLDLVIVGGESGPRARPMHPDWARSLRDQCVAAGVAFHFKQWGEYSPEKPSARSFIDHSFGGKGPGMYRVGKKAAGRLLDGRTWDQMPGWSNV